MFSMIYQRSRRFICPQHRKFCSNTSKQDKKRRIMFFGNDNFSLATLKLLHEAMLQNRVVSKLEVCTSSDRITTTSPDGVVTSLTNPVSDFCDIKGLQHHKWPPHLFENSQPDFDVGVVASFGKMLTSKIISSFPQGVLNVHGSLLPRWRGASPINHAIMAGDQETGISIMEILPYRFDIGRILAQRATPIGPEQNLRELTEVMATIGAELMLDVLSDLDNHYAEAWTQDEGQVTYAPKIDKSLFEIDWFQLSANDVYHRWRGLSGPFGKLYSTWADTGDVVRFEDCVHPDIVRRFNIDINGGKNCSKERASEQTFKPGRVIFVKRGSNKILCIKCSSGWIGFNVLTVGTRKNITAGGFYNGYISNQKHRAQYFKTP